MSFNPLEELNNVDGVTLPKGSDDETLFQRMVLATTHQTQIKKLKRPTTQAQNPVIE